MIDTLSKDWQSILKDEFGKSYFVSLSQQVETAYLSTTVFPLKSEIFTAFKNCPFAKVKVVILGQDPYHSRGQAHGLAFSVPETAPIPPSLRNIYKEIESDVGTPMPQSGNLNRLANQGVLLLNSSLSVEEAKPGSHINLGWENFTDSVVAMISEKREHVVFLLWGNFAQSKRKLVDETKHLVLTASHPSPLSAHRGFFGCRHFSKTNNYLKENNLEPIIW